MKPDSAPTAGFVSAGTSVGVDPASVRLSKVVHVEALQNSKSTANKDSLVDAVRAKVEEAIMHNDFRDLGLGVGGALSAHVDRIHFSGDNGDASPDPHLPCAPHWRYHVYKLDSSGAQLEDIEENTDESAVHAARTWLLPAADFDGLWESLVFDAGIKESLLNYVNTTLMLSERRVDTNLASFNRVVLLHGPPGTGKTSLCKALAHKLCIRLGSKFDYGHLIEINSHSLMSKWFSESGKLVQKMFETIEALVDDPRALVFVLVDEVESLAAARNQGNEPSDAVRVVNAVLTQLDNMKRLTNVLILTTSNISGMIDAAFVDRADLKKYIGLPSSEAAFNMLKSGIDELVGKGVVQRDMIYSYRCVDHPAMSKNSVTEGLLAISNKCNGMSGRTIRKLPFFACVKLRLTCDDEPVSLKEFLRALDLVVDDELEDRKNLKL